MDKKSPRRSLAKNALLSGGQKLISIVFPLITFPYISRVLSVEGIGKISYIESIVSYFVLVSGLGIANYATREGARIRDDQKQLDRFVGEMFTLNLLSTFIAYSALIVTLILLPNLRAYSILFLIESFSIIGTTLGVNWIYAIQEDYLYITIRTITVQFISLVLMFLLIHQPSDYITYASITVFAMVGGNVFNFFHAKKYVRLSFTLHINLRKHLKPILIIFASAIAVSIYVNSDMTLLGWLGSTRSVGLYSRSVKIYTIIKQMIASMVIVALPRLSSQQDKNSHKNFIRTANKILLSLLMLVLPVGIGMVLTAKNIILIIAGEKYLDATFALAVLGVASIFAVLSSFTTYCLLLPLRFEKIQMQATYISAALNIILNLFIIKYFEQNGAAVTTLISEIAVFFFEAVYVVHKTGYGHIFYVSKRDSSNLIFASISVILIAIFLRNIFASVVIDFILTVVCCAGSYFGILKLGKYSALQAPLN